MDLGRPIARHTARRPQESQAHLSPADAPQPDVQAATSDAAEPDRSTTPEPASVGRQTR